MERRSGLLIGIAVAVICAACAHAQSLAPAQEAHLCAQSGADSAANTEACTPAGSGVESPASDQAAPLVSSKHRRAKPAAVTANRARDYARGLAARQAWEQWYASQTGDAGAGATYWAANRSLRHHRTCADAAPAEASPDWRTGCEAAQTMLAADDRLRKSSRAYRRGWNSIPDTPGPKPTETPTGAPSSNGGGINLVVIGVGGLVYLISRLTKTKPASPRPAAPAPTPMKASAAPPKPAAPKAATPAIRVTVPTGAVSPQELRTESEAAWRRAGQKVEVQGVVITGGLIYVASQLRAKNGYGSPDNCLIDPTLEARGGGQDDPDAGLSYWPSYSRLPASTRRAYLEWLASDRADPATKAGYVFLYFYGLERRLMLDEVPSDAPAVLAEVERLRKVYGTNASFRGYSGRLITAARARFGLDAEGVPVFERVGGELPLALRVALGQFAKARSPVPPNWMLSWAISHPDLYPRISLGRDEDAFKVLFATRWAAASHGGAVFTDAELSSLPRLQCAYRAASNSFERSVSVGEALPDVSGARALVERAHKVAVQCTEELGDYSRLIGRRPEAMGSILAGSLLPMDCEARQRAQEAVARQVAGPGRQTVGELISWAEASPPPENLSAGQWRKHAVAFRTLGFGVTPDPNLTMVRITPDLPACLHRLPPGSDETPEAMSAAALVLQIGALVATADGEVSEDERTELLQAAAGAKLDPRQLARLNAQAEWLLDNPARPSDLKQRLAKASPETRAWVVDVALEVARRDGRVVAAEVRQLEQIFAWLDLPNSRLYSFINGGEPVEIAAADVAPAGQTLRPPPPVRRRLDPDRIARITEESARSASLLHAVFADEEELPPPPIPEPATGDDQEAFSGLSAGLACFARGVCTREAWSPDELQRLAQSQGVMLEGAMESLNDWALERFDDLLIEDGDPVRVNRQHLTQAVGSL